MNTDVDEVSNRTMAETALARISVRPPYFDLRDLHEVGDGLVVATVPLAPPTGTEVGAIAAAQVARHLAILGSCAAALTRDDHTRHHYLATRAHYTRLSNAPSTIAEPLQAEAVASWSDRRTARALIKLSTKSGQGLNLLDVQYTVLSPKIFNRFNPPSSDHEVADNGSLPIIDDANQLPFNGQTIKNGVRVDCGPIPPSLCAGHFPDFPAAPVAIVMGQLCRAGGLAMNHQLDLPNSRYRIEEGHVTAEKLARAGQRLVLEAQYLKPVRGGHELSGLAFADDEVVGEMQVTMSSHGPDPTDDSC